MSPVSGPFTLDEQQLVAWGRAVGRAVATPVVFALRGDLGAGKSVLARAIARGAGVAGALPSPTFNLLFEYRANERVVSHLDLYRLEDPSEVWELGWRDLGQGEEIVLIEWPEKAEALLPPTRWDVYLQPSDSSPLLRQVSVAPAGEPAPIPLPVIA
ncbi:MAG: tRNA (adenosine(37)-N6)-threonylcarbamoyltransferase complex ATPase subunit type 1 TsaE [Gemmatimonadota bacterium]